MRDAGRGGFSFVMLCNVLLLLFFFSVLFCIVLYVLFVFVCVMLHYHCFACFPLHAFAESQGPSRTVSSGNPWARSNSDGGRDSLGPGDNTKPDSRGGFKTYDVAVEEPSGTRQASTPTRTGVPWRGGLEEGLCNVWFSLV
jgi:hypothetical protein